MLPTVKNKETISILSRLKQQGPPQTSEIPADALSLDMTMPEEADGEEENNLLQPIQGGPKRGRKKVRPGMQGPTSSSV